MTSAAFAQDHLLLSEICVRNTEYEFIEIYNPLAYSLPLSGYYLTDLHGDLASFQDFYPYFVVGTILNQDVGDFLVTFPPGFEILSGQALIIAFNGSDFLASYGFEPDFDIKGSGVGVQMQVPFNGFVGSSAGLSNGGETVTLFYWNSISDLVQDVDYGCWSDDLVRKMDKTDISLDGPDTGSDETVFLPDTPVELQDRISGGPHPVGQSFTRMDFSEGNETASGGNGISGHDESSEDLSVTWGYATSTPGSATTAFDRSTWGRVKLFFQN